MTPGLSIGLTYDLRSEYLAMGYGELETAEFDQDSTIDALEDALRGLGHDVTRVGHAKALAAAVGALATHDRWSAKDRVRRKRVFRPDVDGHQCQHQGQDYQCQSHMSSSVAAAHRPALTKAVRTDYITPQD